MVAMLSISQSTSNIKVKNQGFSKSEDLPAELKEHAKKMMMTNI